MTTTIETARATLKGFADPTYALPLAMANLRPAVCALLAHEAAQAAEVIRLRQFRDELHESNNAYLQRARDAEAREGELRKAAQPVCDALTQDRHIWYLDAPDPEKLACDLLHALSLPADPQGDRVSPPEAWTMVPNMRVQRFSQNEAWANAVKAAMKTHTDDGAAIDPVWAVLRALPDAVASLSAAPSAQAPLSDEVKALRPEVLAFAHLMEAQLRANDHKPGWKSEFASDLFPRIAEEADELWEAMVRHGKRLSWGDGWVMEVDTEERIGREAADVANFAMMIADVSGALTAQAQSKGSE